MVSKNFLLLLPPVRDTLKAHGLYTPGARVICGVSGGADSVALACCLALIKEEAGICPTLVHVEHGLRGEASLRDESYVRTLGVKLGLETLVYKGSVPALMQEHGGGAEENARRLRYGFFEQAMTQTKAQALLLAHHRGDMAETVFMHLLRGSGTDGLAGMRECVPFAQGLLLRPFLGINKQTLVDALNREGIAFCTDETNLVPDGLRNRLRLQALPLLDSIVPGAESAIARAAACARQDDDCLNVLTGKWLEEYAYADGRYCYLEIVPLQREHFAIQSRVLRALYERGAGSRQEMHLSFAQTEQLLSFLFSAHNRLTLPGNRVAVKGKTYLRIMPDTVQPLLSPLGDTGSACGGVTITKNAYAGLNGNGVTSQAFPADSLAGAVLRTRMEGDIIHPFGGGEKGLKDYLVDQRVDVPFRPDLLVLAAGHTVLWVPGVGAGCEARITPEQEKESVLLTAQGCFPWKREKEQYVEQKRSIVPGSGKGAD